MQLIKSLNQEHITQLNASKKLSEIEVGDTVKVTWRISDGETLSTRTQDITGVVISKVNRGIDTSITITKLANGVSMTIMLPLYSPLLQKFEILRKSKVRRAKLYYLVGLKGKAARLKERKIKSR